MKKLISIMLSLALILPLLCFPASAEVSDWSFLAAKYSSSTHNIIAPKSDGYKIKTEGFMFRENFDKGIDVYTPSYKEFNGAFGVSAIASKKSLSLEGLSVAINLNEFDFTQDHHYRSNQISFIWSDKPVTEIAGGLTNGSYTTGLYSSGRMASGGLRNIVSPDTKGLCITLSNADGANVGTKTAATVSIIYYDGSYTDQNGNIGYSWTFTRNPADGASPFSDIGIKTTPYESIDLSFGLIISIVSDPLLGYVININGKNYYGTDAGYRNSDRSNIDLSALTDIPDGYITVGAVSNDDRYLDSHNCSYTLSRINTEPPARLWDHTPVPHEHIYTENIIFPTCTEDGYTLYICSCGNKYKRNIIPTAGHIPGEWVNTDENTKVRCCSVCNMPMDSITTFPEPDILGGYTDVKTDAWYADSVRYVLKKGYMMGMDTHIFSPNTDLTREQFVTILANMADVDTDEYKNEQLMSDVKPSHWFAGAVNWAVKEGYVAGVSEGVFGAGQPIQRAALARLLYLYAEKNGKETDEVADLSEYTDYDKVQEWMRDGLGWAVKHGIITSIKDDSLTLDPKGIATRSQCARMLMIYDSVPDTELPDTPEPDVPTPEPDTDPLGVDEEALKEFLKNGSTETYDEVYFFDILSLTLVYYEGEELLYAEYGNGRNYPPHFFSYEFGTDKVYIHGPGEFMPPIEYGDDLSLIKPYLRVIATAEMTAEGIINAPEKYKLELDRMYMELTDLLKVLDISE